MTARASSGIVRPGLTAVGDMSVDQILAELREYLPFSLDVEIYTDVDRGWDVYVHGDLPGRREDRHHTYHAARTGAFRDVLAALLLEVWAEWTDWDPNGKPQPTHDDTEVSH